MKIYLDDIRPCPEGYVLARSVKEAIKLVETHGFPEYVSFDHDLGLNQRTGLAFAKYLVMLDIEHNNMPKGFTYNIHSANIVGQQNIDGLLLCYLLTKEFEDV